MVWLISTAQCVNFQRDSIALTLTFTRTGDQIGDVFFRQIPFTVRPDVVTLPDDGVTISHLIDLMDIMGDKNYR